MHAVRLYRRLQAVLRLSVEDRFEPATAPKGLRLALARAAALGGEFGGPGLDFERLEDHLDVTEAAVHAIFTRFCPRGAVAKEGRADAGPD